MEQRRHSPSQCDKINEAMMDSPAAPAYGRAPDTEITDSAEMTNSGESTHA